MPSYIVFTDSIYPTKRGRKTFTRRHEIEAPDILTACERAKKRHLNSEVSMFWEDYSLDNVQNVSPYWPYENKPLSLLPYPFGCFVGR